MANPTLPHDTLKLNLDGVYLEVEGIIVNDKVLMKAQESTIADAAAATAATTLTVTGTAVVLSNMDDGSSNNTLIAVGDTSSTNQSGNIEQNFDKLGDEINAHVVDFAALKVNYDKVITDVASIRSQLNALLQQLEDHGILADA